MSELQWFPWGRNSYTTTWPPKSGRWYRLVPGLDGWVVWAPGFSAAIRVTLPPMPVQQAQKAAEMYVIFGGHYA